MARQRVIGLHSGRRRSMSALAIFGVVVVVVSACSGPEPTSDAPQSPALTSDVVVGGQISFSLESEPTSLNMYSTAGDTMSTSIITGPVLAQFMTVAPDGALIPDLLAGEPRLETTPTHKVFYELDEASVWADGSPVTADDVQFTLDQILNPANDIANRDGYNKVKDGRLVDVSDDKRSFAFEFSEPYGPWRYLFSAGQPVLKKAALEGQDFNTALNETIPFASGPFRVDSWNRGTELALVRNDGYRRDHTSYLDRVSFRFQDSPEAMSTSLASREVDVAYQVTRPELASLVADIAGIDVQITAGPIWEHLDFNLRNPLLQLAEVREALAYAIDRDAIVADVVQPLDPTATPLDNVFFMVDSGSYEPHWDIREPDKARVDELLAEAGFTKGPDGIYTRGIARLRLELLTTQDQMRTQTAELLTEQLGAVGIELDVQYRSRDELLDRIANCEYEIALYATRSSPDPATTDDAYRADSITCPGDEQNLAGFNSTAYRNIEVTELIRKADAELDARTRERLYQEVDKLIARDIPTLPLYQRATVLAYVDTLVGVDGNATRQGPTWNLGGWWRRPTE